MIQIAPQMRILLAVEPVDFRKGTDGLAAVCRARLDADPLAGALFVFRSRSCKALKLLMYDGQGFWICQKRLSTGRFEWWPSDQNSGGVRVDPHELHLLLWNGDPSRAVVAPMWRAVGTSG
ncbi:MAG: IS66 family insertion sequence element accessory protein TnpB [Verrucomicrobiae bacterium]|nr:IS66 family insertion sequence element accessory protein TnpB [Verrucomicrobiae bacterium]